ncbi:MAG: glycosyltransferase [Puniceicoccaceae bacterium]
MLETFLFVVWLICRVIMIVLIVIFLVSGIDDLIVDCVYYFRALFRFLFKRNKIKPVTWKQLEAVPEKPVAVMVPAWREADVIADMILNFRKSVKYDNWVLFVGTYPNDPDTFREAERARCYIPNTEVVVTPAPGPTSKSDCLNWIYQGVLYYIMGLSLRGMKGRKIFLQQYIEMEREVRTPILGRKKTKRVRELVATKEYFPATFSASARQKSRWTLGIGLQGWRIGWTIHPLINYWLWRDRKGLLNSFAVMTGYAVALFLGIFYVMGLFFPALQLPLILREGDWVVSVLYVVLALFGWRLLNRFICTTRFYNLFQGFLAVPRMLVGNFVNFWAAWIAVRQFVRAKIRRENPAWIKTDHAFPTRGQLTSYHRRLGEILVERGLVTQAQLDEALAEQEKSGRKLGEILVERELLWEEDLVEALAIQKGNAFVELDPDGVDPDLLEKIPEETARAMRVFPVSFRNNVFVLATDVINLEEKDSEEGRDRRERELGERFGAAIRMAWASTRDLDFAIDRAYSAPPANPRPIPGRLGERLVRMGRLTREELIEALRIQKRSREKLGRILVGMGKATEAESCATPPCSENPCCCSVFSITPIPAKAERGRKCTISSWNGTRRSPPRRTTRRRNPPRRIRGTDRPGKARGRGASSSRPAGDSR